MTEKLKKIVERLDVEFPEYKDYEVALAEDDNGILFEITDDEGKTESEKVNDIKVDINDLLKAQDLMTDETGYVMEYGHFYDDESFESVADEIENEYGNKITKIIIECLDGENHPTVKYEFTKHLTSDEKDEVDEGIKTLVKEKCADLKLQDLDLDDDYDDDDDDFIDLDLGSPEDDDDFSIEIYRKGKNDPEFKHDFYSAYKAKEYAIEHYINDDSIEEMFIIAHTENGPSQKDYWNKDIGWYNDKLQDAEGLFQVDFTKDFFTKNEEYDFMIYVDEYGRDEFYDVMNAYNIEAEVEGEGEREGLVLKLTGTKKDLISFLISLFAEQWERSGAKILFEHIEPVEKEALDKVQDNSDYRIINTGLENNNKNNELLNSVIGQLSDGIWENSNMNRYWEFLEIDGVNILSSLKPFEKEGGRLLSNATYNLNDEQIRKYFATKLKQIVKKEGLEWNRDNQEVSSYLGYGEEITVADVYKAYDVLLGRKNKVQDDDKAFDFTKEEAFDRDNIIDVVSSHMELTNDIEGIKFEYEVDDNGDITLKASVDGTVDFKENDILDDDVEYDVINYIEVWIDDIVRILPQYKKSAEKQVNDDWWYNMSIYNTDDEDFTNQFTIKLEPMATDKIQDDEGLYEVDFTKHNDFNTIDLYYGDVEHTRLNLEEYELTPVLDLDQEEFVKLTGTKENLINYFRDVWTESSAEIIIKHIKPVNNKVQDDKDLFQVDFTTPAFINFDLYIYHMEMSEFEFEVNEHNLEAEIDEDEKEIMKLTGTKQDLINYFKEYWPESSGEYCINLIEPANNLLNRDAILEAINKNKVQDEYPDHNKMRAAILEAIGDKIAKLSLTEYLNETYVKFIYTQDLTEEEKSDIRLKVDNIVAEHRKLADHHTDDMDLEEDEYVFIKEFKHNDYTAEIYEDVNGEYYWSAEYIGGDRSLGNFNIYVGVHGIELSLFDEKGYESISEATNIAKQRIDKERSKWND